MDSWMRAAPIATTAIGRHLLVRSRVRAPLGVRTQNLSRPELPASTCFSAGGQEAAQAAPFSVNAYGAEFLPCHVPRKPKLRLPCAATDAS